MDAFEKAYASLRKVEGGYANNPADPGGETYIGIARRYNPTWPGWPILDAIPNKRQGRFFPAVEPYVKDFYRTGYWTRFSLDRLQDVEVAEAVLDTLVNHGKGGTLVQVAAQRVGVPISVDGKVGPATVSSLNTLPAKQYLASLYEVRKEYYYDLVAKNPTSAVFLKGWLARIDKWKVEDRALAAFLLLAAAAILIAKKKSIL